MVETWYLPMDFLPSAAQCIRSTVRQRLHGVDPPSPMDRDTNPVPSSSAAFGTPIHPVRSKQATDATNPTILPIALPAATLRPLAFRTFTKKHSLTLTSSALQLLATFIGTHCGSGWREEGLAEKVLDEAAKAWKKNGGSVIIPGEGSDFADILQNIGRCMLGGRIVHQRAPTRHDHALQDRSSSNAIPARPGTLSRDNSRQSLGLTTLGLEDNEADVKSQNPRSWLRVVDAFEQPRLAYNAAQKMFEVIRKRASLLPDPSCRMALIRDRYNIVHQRLMRNEAFQTSAVAQSRSKTLQRSSAELVMPQQAYKLTPVANLLGRSGSTHVLLGLLGTSPTGDLILSDLTGSIALDLHHARPVPEDGAWFTPGMIVLTEGLYEEEGSVAGPGLAGDGGVGGMIGGVFHVSSVGGPPCERREVTLGVTDTGKNGTTVAAGGFGWTDFLGVGSERANGSMMRGLEKKVLEKHHLASRPLGRSRVIILGEVNLDNSRTLAALKQLLGLYALEEVDQTPMAFVLIGNFTRYAVLAGSGSGGSIEYKEYFDSLASVLSDYPSMLEDSTFVFIPGDNDPWASAFSAGATAVLPKRRLPEMYTSRVKRAFAAANAEAKRPADEKKLRGEVIWSSNPSRLTMFGPAQEMVVFRDDLSGRLRRKALRFHVVAEPDSPGAGSAQLAGAPSNGPDTTGQEYMDVDPTIESAESVTPNPSAQDTTRTGLPSDVHTARKLVKTMLDQGYLSPFPLTDRPVLWDFGGSLSLYPLPSALVLMDPEVPPFALTYEGCHAMNPGPLVAPGQRGVAQWIEYDTLTRKGRLRDKKLEEYNMRRRVASILCHLSYPDGLSNGDEVCRADQRQYQTHSSDAAVGNAKGDGTHTKGSAEGSSLPLITHGDLAISGQPK
ncbi:MAG: hypothetical protein Q9169_001425 [Polycauliona sp. 2 TL-2023]